MNPPYEITSRILQLVVSVSHKLGQINAKYLDKPSTNLRKTNRIKTIHSSLGIEGNTLTEEQITALLEKKRVVGPKKDVLEVLNAIQVYDKIHSFDPFSTLSFLEAHQLLMNNLVEDNGRFRKKGVGIMAGDNIAHVAPPSENVPHLMNDLFHYLKNSQDSVLIKSCVFHYEMEFIHPFVDGNGRMGRLWQTLILMQEYPVFEFIPFENIIQQTQSAYYQALAESDRSGNSTSFIAYMLTVIDEALGDMLDNRNPGMLAEDRLAYFSDRTKLPFTRKDYMHVFKEVSTATASRDLKQGVDLGLFHKEGDKKKTIYRVRKH
jgi:Fic family protein